MNILLIQVDTGERVEKEIRKKKERLRGKNKYTNGNGKQPKKV